MMKHIVLSCLLLGVASASRVSHQKCDSDKGGYVEINMIDVKDAIRFPSNISAAIDVDVLKPIPERATIQLEVYRVFRLFGRDRHIKIPCISKAGSCTYDVCNFLVKRKEGPGFDLCSLWPEGTPCQCPLGEMTLKRDNAQLGFPSLPGIAKLLVNGNYAVTAKFVDPADGKSFFCVDIKASLG